MSDKSWPMLSHPHKCTLPETNIPPENRPSQIPQEISMASCWFQGEYTNVAWRFEGFMSTKLTCRRQEGSEQIAPTSLKAAMSPVKVIPCGKSMWRPNILFIFFSWETCLGKDMWLGRDAKALAELQDYCTSEGPAMKLKHPVGVLQSVAIKPLMLVSRWNNCTKRQRSFNIRDEITIETIASCVVTTMIFSKFLETSANTQTHFITPFDWSNIIRRWQSQICDWVRLFVAVGVVSLKLSLYNMLLGGGFYTTNWKMQQSYIIILYSLPHVVWIRKELLTWLLNMLKPPARL